MARKAKHLNPIAASSVLERYKRGRSYVIAKAQYSPDPAKAERVHLFVYGRWFLRKVLDVWLTPEDSVHVQEGLGAAVGASDAMYGTRPRYVWAATNEGLLFWKNGFLVGRFSPLAVCVRRHLFRGWSCHPSGGFVQVHGFLSKDWFRRGVALVAKDGEQFKIAEATELSVLLDPTYDGLDLLGDSGWVSELAAAVAMGTGLSVTVDKGL